MFEGQGKVVSADRIPRVALVVDNPYRDLRSLTLLAIWLARHGVASYLVPLSLRLSELPALAPDLVLAPYLRERNQVELRRLISWGIKVCILDNEGTPGSVIFQDDILADDPEVWQEISRYFSFGSEFTKFLVKNGRVPADKIVTTGSLKHDALVAPWRDGILDSTSEIEPYGENLILLNTNFPLVNHFAADVEEYYNFFTQKYGLSPDLVRLMQNAAQESLHGFVHLADRLAERFPAATVVLRPHPAEVAATYENLINSRNNLHVVKSGGIEGWVLRARVVIQRSCGTSIDSAIAGVPTLSPKWIKTEPEQDVYERVSVPCASEDVMMDTVDAILSGRFEKSEADSDEALSLLRSWYHLLDGQAHARIGEEILTVLGERDKEVDRKTCEDWVYRMPVKGVRARHWAHAAFLRRTGLPAQWSFLKLSAVDDYAWWDSAERAYDCGQVTKIVEYLHGAAYLKTERPMVAFASDLGDYIGGYLGRAVGIGPDAASISGTGTQGSRVRLN